MIRVLQREPERAETSAELWRTWYRACAAGIEVTVRTSKVQSGMAVVPADACVGEVAVRVRGDTCRALVRGSDALGSRADLWRRMARAAEDV